MSTLFTPAFNDQRDQVVGGSSANALAGIAITGNAATAAQGEWRYSTDGGTTWTAIATTGLGDTTAIILPSSAMLRFVPAGGFVGTPGALQVRLIDTSGGPVAFSAAADVTINGGTSAISSLPGASRHDRHGAARYRQHRRPAQRHRARRLPVERHLGTDRQQPPA